jgi:adenylosuccinate lyase
MRENLLEGSYGLVFSQPVLLALVGAGCDRDAAYAIVQRDARLSAAERRPFRAVLETDGELAAVLGDDRVASVLDAAFDLERALRHVHRITDAVRGVGW